MIEVPMGDFFCKGWTEYCHVNSLPITANSHTASTAYWYQTEPHTPFPQLPDREYLEVI